MESSESQSREPFIRHSSFAEVLAPFCETLCSVLAGAVSALDQRISPFAEHARLLQGRGDLVEQGFKLIDDL